MGELMQLGLGETDLGLSKTSLQTNPLFPQLNHRGVARDCGKVSWEHAVMKGF